MTFRLQRLQNLKSNMDRFIEQRRTLSKIVGNYLKSNMDRFIEEQSKQQMS